MGYDSVRTPILGYGTDNVGTVEQSLDLTLVQQPVPVTAASLNLLTNGSFEVADGWVIGAGWTVPFASATAHHEASVARLVALGSPGELVSAAVPLTAIEDSYIVNFFARLVDHTTGVARVVLRSYDVAGVLLDEHLLIEMGADYAEEELLGVWLGVSKQFAPNQEEEIDDVLSEDTVSVRLVFMAVDADLTFEVDAAQISRGWLETTFAPAPNENIDGSAILPGTLPAEALDTTPPAVPTGLTLTSDAVLGADGAAISSVYASLTHPTDGDYVGCEVQITGNYEQSVPGNPATRVPQWVWAQTFSLPKDAERVTLVPAVGGAPYWARARSLDQTGNRSAFTPIVLLPAALDADAPPIPAISQAIRGFRSVGIWWPAVLAPDIAHYEVRWRPRQELVAGTGGAGTIIEVQEWTVAKSKATVLVVTDLETTDMGPDPLNPEWTYYNFQVRAIDLSGNVRQGRTLDVTISVDALIAAGTVDVADGRGVLPGSSLVLEGDVTVYSIRAVDMALDGIAATLTIEPPLVADADQGVRGVADFVSVMPVNESDTHAGWSPSVVEYPSLVGSADYAANSILANAIKAGEIITDHLTSGIINTDLLIGDEVIVNRNIATYTLTANRIATSGLDADQIKAGTLILGGVPPVGEERTNPQVLLVRDPDGNDMVIIDKDGVLLIDPAHPERQVRWYQGVMSFTADDWVTSGVAIDGRGIIADSISVGTAPGGHNAIPNPSFERTPVIGAPNSKVWTSAADWQSHLASTDLNIDDSATDLRMTTVAYT